MGWFRELCLVGCGRGRFVNNLRWEQFGYSTRKQSIEPDQRG
jgi:hypothetical protein